MSRLQGPIPTLTLFHIHIQAGVNEYVDKITPLFAYTQHS